MAALFCFDLDFFNDPLSEPVIAGGPSAKRGPLDDRINGRSVLVLYLTPAAFAFASNSSNC